MCGRPAGWRVLADRARLGQPASRLPLRASVAGLGGHIVAATRLQLVISAADQLQLDRTDSVDREQLLISVAVIDMLATRPYNALLAFALTLLTAVR